MSATKRTALITGAGRGVGRACAIALAGAGFQVALTARNSAELADTATACGEASLVVPADLTAPGAVDQIFGAVEASFGPVDVLVANAGGAITSPVAKTTDADWQRMLDLNLTAPFQCFRRALPAMVVRRWGRIVAIGSVASRQGAPYIAAYTAAKHGLLGLVRATAMEVVKSGVTVNAVCPGFIDSAMTDGSVARIVEATGRTPEQARAILEAQQPINRLITPEEVAAAVMFCVHSPAVTGQGFNVDGGTVQS